ncbi:MAG: hypothetical protein IT198_05575 [Acidimicrobiia bacterium]|nr:hypothetical protein [Acidimicrobiia bacterium]
MPELPEVEVARRQLEREVAGRKVRSVDVQGKGVVAVHRSKADFTKRLADHKVKSFDRRGLWILGKLDKDDIWAVSPGATGRFFRAKSGKVPRGLPIKLSVSFTTGGSVHLLDTDDTAKKFVVAKDELADVPEIAALGLDPLETPVPWSTFGGVLRTQPRAKLKALLQDDSLVAGLGSLYSDEILFHAGLRYDRSPDSLSAHEIRRLYRSMVETLASAVKHGGVSFDTDDVDMFGNRGEFDTEIEVYQRQGETCHRCRGTIERARFQKKYTFYCPACQS